MDEAPAALWTPEIDAILSKGSDLLDLGLSNWALSKDAAIDAVKRIGHLGVGILGGDVYARGRHGIAFDYGGWHSDPAPAELDAAFVTRSVAEAILYISGYPDDAALFSIVPHTGAPKS